MKYLLLLSILNFILWGCTPTKDVSKTSKTTLNSDKKGPSITTYIIKFTSIKDSHQFNSALFKSIKASGYLKPQNNPHQITDKSIKVEILNDKDEIIYSKLLDNPLYKTLEYTEDEKFKKKDIYLDEIFFSIETQGLLNPKMIKISSDLNNIVQIQSINL